MPGSSRLAPSRELHAELRRTRVGVVIVVETLAACHPGQRRFELDPSWLVIRVLAALRQIVITGPPVRLPPDRGVLR